MYGGNTSFSLLWYKPPTDQLVQSCVKLSSEATFRMGIKNSTNVQTSKKHTNHQIWMFWCSGGSRGAGGAVTPSRRPRASNFPKSWPEKAITAPSAKKIEEERKPAIPVMKWVAIWLDVRRRKWRLGLVQWIDEGKWRW